jgi:hypothetical protein
MSDIRYRRGDIRYRWRRAALAGLLAAVAGCASGPEVTGGSASAPSRVYVAERTPVWNAVRTVALSLPTWEIVAVDEPQGVVLVEQRFRDRSFGGESRMTITVTPLDASRTQVEVRTTEAGASLRGSREHAVARFFGELEQLLGQQ